MIENILRTLLVGLVTKEDSVQIETVDEGHLIIFKVVVDKSDIGRVIGKEGRIANALSMIINSISYKTPERKKYIIKINENQR